MGSISITSNTRLVSWTRYCWGWFCPYISTALLALCVVYRQRLTRTVWRWRWDENEPHSFSNINNDSRTDHPFFTEAASHLIISTSHITFHKPQSMVKNSNCNFTFSFWILFLKNSSEWKFNWTATAERNHPLLLYRKLATQRNKTTKNIPKTMTARCVVAFRVWPYVCARPLDPMLWLCDDPRKNENENHIRQSACDVCAC